MNREFVLLAGGLLALAACTVDKAGPLTSGETHFLTTCESDQSCGGLQCVAQVCTQACATNADCSRLSPGAICAASTDGLRQVCEVPCADNSACASLSARHVCQAGHCRATASGQVAAISEDSASREVAATGIPDAAGPEAAVLDTGIVDALVAETSPKASQCAPSAASEADIAACESMASTIHDVCVTAGTLDRFDVYRSWCRTQDTSSLLEAMRCIRKAAEAGECTPFSAPAAGYFCLKRSYENRVATSKAFEHYRQVLDQKCSLRWYEFDDMRFELYPYLSECELDLATNACASESTCGMFLGCMNMQPGVRGEAGRLWSRQAEIREVHVTLDEGGTRATASATFTAAPFGCTSVSVDSCLLTSCYGTHLDGAGTTNEAVGTIDITEVANGRALASLRFTGAATGYQPQTFAVPPARTLLSFGALGQDLLYFHEELAVPSPITITSLPEDPSIPIRFVRDQEYVMRWSLPTPDDRVGMVIEQRSPNREVRMTCSFDGGLESGIISPVALTELDPSLEGVAEQVVRVYAEDTDSVSITRNPSIRRVNERTALRVRRPLLERKFLVQ